MITLYYSKDGRTQVRKYKVTTRSTSTLSSPHILPGSVIDLGAPLCSRTHELPPSLVMHVSTPLQQLDVCQLFRRRLFLVPT